MRHRYAALREVALHAREPVGLVLGCEEEIETCRRTLDHHQDTYEIIHCSGRAQVGHQGGILCIQQIEDRHLATGVCIAYHIEEARKNNFSDDSIRRAVAALRKAGLPEGTGA